MNNVQLRIGLAYNWNSKGVVRVGYGIFNDKLATSIGQVFNTAEYQNRGNLPDTAVLFSGVTTFGGRFDQTIVAGPPATVATINFLTTGQTPIAGAPTLNSTLDGHLRTPYSEQASLQISQELPGKVALTASYLYVRGVKLEGFTANLNAVATLPPMFLPSGPPAPGQQYFWSSPLP